MSKPGGTKTHASPDAILNRLLSLHPKVIDLSLERIERLLNALGNPERKIPPVIHVAGTNGKGSVVAYLRAILEAGGYRTHVYTSPHLVRFNERIRLAGELISDADLSAVLAECEDANAGQSITFFEITTAAALLAFSRVEADVTILEVGLGGRLDATNVIEKPLVSVITPIHYDHESFLGNKLQDIAGEKAGIIKAGCPTVVGLQTKTALNAIERVAAECQSQLHVFRRDWSVMARGEGTMRFQDRQGVEDLPVPALLGQHQIQNAGIALATLRLQNKFAITNAAIKAGLEWARWPARLQGVEDGPLMGALPKGADLYIDGGHNIAAALALKRYFRGLSDVDVPFYLVTAMLKSKNIEGFLSPFRGIATGLIAVPMPGEHDAYTSDELAAEGKVQGIQTETADDIPSALKRIAHITKKSPPPVVLVTGSLYLAGEALRLSGLDPD